MVPETRAAFERQRPLFSRCAAHLERFRRASELGRVLENQAFHRYLEHLKPAEVFRGRFRSSFEKPEPLVPSQVSPFTIDLHANDHTFLKGHRIMVQVQSTWFPIIGRNPQKFVPNIFNATAADYQEATQRIYRSRSYPSNVELPVAAK